MKQLFVILTLMIALVGTATAQKKSNPKQVTEQEKHLKLYPTMADKYVNIYAEFDAPQDFTLRLPPTELNNEKSWEVRAKESYQTSLDVTQLPDGTYTIILQYNGKKEVDTFYIERK